MKFGLSAFRCTLSAKENYQQRGILKAGERVSKQHNCSIRGLSAGRRCDRKCKCQPRDYQTLELSVLNPENEKGKSVACQHEAQTTVSQKEHYERVGVSGGCQHQARISADPGVNISHITSTDTRIITKQRLRLMAFHSGTRRRQPVTGAASK